MPTLKELEARFLSFREETPEEMAVRGVIKPTYFLSWVDNLRDAHGINFICPKSFAVNGGQAGAHSIQVYFEGSPVPDHVGCNSDGKPVRWKVSGTCMDDLSLTPSIHEQSEHCGWHGFVGSSSVPPGSAA